MHSAPRHDRITSRPGQDETGHLLVGLMVLVAVMLIMLAVTGQTWSFIMRRDNEAEMIFRGEQYIRALEFFQKENSGFPNDIKVLAQKGPHRHRYIRKLYSDPMAKDGKWGLLYLSPTGAGFVNIYASPSAADMAFAAGGLGEDTEGEGEGFGSGPAAPGGKMSKKGVQQGPPKNYTQFTGEQFKAMGGELTGLPIVGVVHKKKETGLKLYRNMASLNDWAFTPLAEGQNIQYGGTTKAGRPTMPQHLGLGDTTTPIYLRPTDKPGYKPRGKGLSWQIRDSAQQEAKEEEERATKEREQGNHDREADDEDVPPPDPNVEAPQDEGDGGHEGEGGEGGDDGDDGGDGEDQADPNAPRDPNAPLDPNAPADPNHHGIH